jgi:photosystem II stability/assembly factor-like uncharacterized protein
MRAILPFAVAVLLSNVAAAQWTAQPSGSKARLRGLAVVNKNVIWASGTQGTYVRTIDGGMTWSAGTVQGADSLDFRDVHASDEHTAFLLSIGEGEKSRIYQTTDGGTTWTLRFTNRDPRVFLDAIAFWDADHGIALGDPVDGRFTILTSEDSGITWKRSPLEQMPLALKGEGAFAASGTCLIVQGKLNAWFGTGGTARARVFRTSDRGQSWTVHETPVASGVASAGIFSLAFRDELNGIAVGGDYKAPDQTQRVIATTADGGVTWTKPVGAGPTGYRSAVCFVPGANQPLVVCVGPAGSDLSSDGGRSWKPLGKQGFHAVAFVSPIDGGWGVGEGGLIARWRGALPSPR